MGDHEGWVQPPSGLLPNGLLPNEAANVLQVLDSVRWSKAEERTAELIASIQPNAPSEGRRNAVADYVKRLIMKCFPCQVFTFGSVPLKTYLPDGDIDLTAFSKNQNLKDTWAHQVRDMLESEEKSQNAEFRVKEVQYIQAEVKIIKCLVENIVVDISFNQLGGLCTLCFLEEVDNLINHNYLFKRSIILIKAWCYYESRILGAHHGLISTYALEALVLYIFHVYNNSFSGPLEVLYRFLEFFSKFDWDNFCVSLWGPVPISSLPDVTAKPPRKDSGDLLLSKEFLEICSSTYAVFPGGQENQGQPFVSKHFNVIDPLRVNNNLGRSVSKGNFFRIRSAFAFGAKRLARLLECSEKDISFEINQFFMNTWERHGSGHRPDAPSNDLCYSRLPKSEQLNESEGPKNKSSDRSNVFSSFKSQGVGVRQSHSLNSRQDHSLLETTSRNSNVSTTSRVQAESRGDQDNSKFEQRKNEINVNQSTINKIQQCSANDIQGRFLVVRTYSSPELTDSYGEVSSLVRHNKTPEGVKTRTSMRMDFSGRKKPELSSLTHTSTRPSTDYRSTIGHDLSRNNLDVVVDINNYPDDSESSVVGEDSSPRVGAQGMHEEEQDHVNLIGSSMAHSFNGLVHVPLNMGSGHLQFPILPSVLDSMGFGQRNFSGMVPPNIPLIETSWGSNVHFPHGLMSSPLSHYFPGMGLNSSLEDPIELANGNSGCVERSSREADDEFCHEQDRDSIGGFDTDNGAIEMPRSDNKLQSTSGAYNFSPSRRSLPGNYKRVQQKFTKENEGPTSEEHGNLQYQDDTGNEIHLDDRIASSRSSPVARTSSIRSKTTSESSWDGSSAKVSKSMREKRGRKTAYLVVPSSANGKGKSVSEQSSSQIDDDNRDAGRTEMAERSIGPQSVSSLHIQRHEVPGYEMAQSSGSEPILPLGPVLIGPPSQQRGLDSGAVPFAFYPTGPPIPFVTMVPFYNFPSEGTSDASTSHFSGHEVADSDSGQNFDSSVRHDQPEVLSTLSPRTATSIEPSECNGGNILNSDFPSHLQNLQYGRSCQNSRFPSVISPSPVAVPPMYLQGHYPWDGPGRPLSGNMNPITLSYGSRVVPVAPFQSVSNRPTSVYQHYTDEMPRYRSGTGTYLPNPKVTGRDRHSTSGRRGHYNLGDHQGDKEDNWNVAKSRGAGRSHGRNQAEKTNLRMNANENRAERPWGSRHDSHPPYKSQSGPLHHSNATQSGSVAYGMYPLRGLNPSALSSNGPSIPSVVMLYPYDHSSSYASPAEQLEFGSLGPIGFSSIGEAPQLNEGSRMSSTLDDQRFHGSPAPQSSPDQPSPNS